MSGINNAVKTGETVDAADPNDPDAFNKEGYHLYNNTALSSTNTNGDLYYDLNVIFNDQIHADFMYRMYGMQVCQDGSTPATLLGSSMNVPVITNIQMANPAQAAVYTYNALGQRVSKTVGGVITYYLYGLEGELLAEMNLNGGIVKEYVYVDGKPLAQIDKVNTTAEKVYYSHNDHLGAPIALTSVNKVVVWKAERTPFGEIASEATNNVTKQRQELPGQYLDAETGWYYNYYRTYDAKMGRYTQSDPIGLNGG